MYDSKKLENYKMVSSFGEDKVYEVYIASNGLGFTEVSEVEKTLTDEEKDFISNRLPQGATGIVLNEDLSFSDKYISTHMNGYLLGLHVDTLEPEPEDSFVQKVTWVFKQIIDTFKEIL